MNIYSKVTVHIGPMSSLRPTTATEMFVPLSLISIQFHAITTIVLKLLTEIKHVCQDSTIDALLYCASKSNAGESPDL